MLGIIIYLGSNRHNHVRTLDYDCYQNAGIPTPLRGDSMEYTGPADPRIFQAVGNVYISFNAQFFDANLTYVDSMVTGFSILQWLSQKKNIKICTCSSLFSYRMFSFLLLGPVFID